MKTKTQDKSLDTRATRLLACLLCAIALHVALHSNAGSIADKFAPTYTPYTAAQSIQLVATIVFSLIYLVLASHAARLVQEWRDSLPQRPIGRGSAIAGEALLPLHKLKRMNAGRSLQNAEDEYRTLESLHEKGLITDEMFEKGKIDLKAALGENQIFRK